MTSPKQQHIRIRIFPFIYRKPAHKGPVRETSQAGLGDISSKRSIWSIF